jgi:hypothetical protein
VCTENEVIRGSGDDLSNWFYQLQEAPSIISRRAFGRSVPEHVARQYGYASTGPHRMALRVLGMGCLNAPDLAQRAHEFVLESEGCLRSESVLRYDRAVPRTRTVEDIYIYIDDHLVVSRVPRSEALSSGGEDRDLIDASYRA